MRRTIILAGIVLCSFGKILAQELAPAQPPPPAQQLPKEGDANVRVITIEECIQLALKHNFAIRIQNYAPQLVGYDLAAAYGAYDPEFRFSAQRRESSSPGGLDPQTGEEFDASQQEVDSFNASLSGLLPSGLTYNLGGNLSDVQGTSQRRVAVTNLLTDTLAFNEASAGAFTLNQPFLRDFWIDATRRTIKILKKDAEISDLVFRFTVMDTVRQVQVTYYNLTASLTNIVVAEDALKLAERSVFEVKKKVEVGALAELEQKAADAEVARARADLIRARYDTKVFENALKSLITDNYAELQPVRLLPAESLEAQPQVFDKGGTWLEALSKRPDYKQQLLELDKANIQLKFTKNQLFPRFDAFGSYAHSAQAPHAGDALEILRRGDFPQHSVGLALTLPLTFRAERYAHRTAKALEAQQRERIKQLEQAILIQVDDAVNLVESAWQSVSATREARIFAEAALDAEQKKFESGKSTTFLVLQFQRDLTAARRDAINSLVLYNQALVELEFRKGTTLEKRGIQLE